MHHYTVRDVRLVQARSKLCLSDEQGRYHVARAIADTPGMGTQLLGEKPALGLGLLIASASGQAYRVLFERIDCTQGEALSMLHGVRAP